MRSKTDIDKHRYLVEPLECLSANYESRDVVERYYQQRKLNFLHKMTEAIVIDETPNRIADLGAGSGIVLDIVKGFNTKGSMAGLDLSIEACKLQHEKGYYTVCGDVEMVPFKDETFDIVFLVDIIEHLHDHTKVLNEANRILKTAGLLLCVTPNKYGFYELKGLMYFDRRLKEDIMYILKGIPRRYYPYHLKFYSSKEIMKILADHKFVTQECKTIGFAFPFSGLFNLAFYKFTNLQVYKSERFLRFLDRLERIFSFFNFIIILKCRKMGCSYPALQQQSTSLKK